LHKYQFHPPEFNELSPASHTTESSGKPGRGCEGKAIQGVNVFPDRDDICQIILQHKTLYNNILFHNI